MGLWANLKDGFRWWTGSLYVHTSSPTVIPWPGRCDVDVDPDVREWLDTVMPGRWRAVVCHDGALARIEFRFASEADRVMFSLFVSDLPHGPARIVPVRTNADSERWWE